MLYQAELAALRWRILYQPAHETLTVMSVLLNEHPMADVTVLAFVSVCPDTAKACLP